jgi:hypothetical protein
LELAFQNALEGCGTEEVTGAELYERIMEEKRPKRSSEALKNRRFKLILDTG